MNNKYKVIEILEEKGFNISKIRVEYENGSISVITVPDENLNGDNNACYRVIAEFAHQEGYSSIIEFIIKGGKIINKNNVSNHNVIIESDEGILKNIKNLKIERNMAMCRLAVMALVPIAIGGIITGDFSLGMKEITGILSGIYTGVLFFVGCSYESNIKKEEEKLMKLK